MIALLYQALKNKDTEAWEKRFVYFWESVGSSDKSWLSFFNRMKKVVNELFEIYYESWHVENRRSKIEYDTFLERETSMKEIMKRNQSRISKRFNEIESIFEDVVLSGPQLV
jgi:hypothetical protein